MGRRRGGAEIQHPTQGSSQVLAFGLASGVPSTVLAPAGAPRCPQPPPAALCLCFPGIPSVSSPSSPENWGGLGRAEPLRMEEEKGRGVGQREWGSLPTSAAHTCLAVGKSFDFY